MRPEAAQSAVCYGKGGRGETRLGGALDRCRKKGSPTTFTMRLRVITWMARLLALAILLWPTWTLVEQVHEAASGREAHPGLYPNGWLLGGPQVEPLRQFLAEAEMLLPPDSRILVDSETYDASQRHYLEMWVAYYLPLHRVTMRRDLPPEGPTFRIFHPPRAAIQGSDEILRSDWASLERVEAP